MAINKTLKLGNQLPSFLNSYKGEFVHLSIDKVNTDSKQGYYKYLCLSIIEQLEELGGAKHTLETLHLFHLEEVRAITPKLFKDKNNNLIAVYQSKHFSKMTDSEISFLIDKAKEYWLNNGIII